MRYVCSSGVSLISARVKWLWITVVKMSVWRRQGLGGRRGGGGQRRGVSPEERVVSEKCRRLRLMFYASVAMFALLGGATTSALDFLGCKLWLLVDPKVEFSPKRPRMVI